ncbi:MAG: YpoC family protein [Sporolactobacillus sp.]
MDPSHKIGIPEAFRYPPFYRKGETEVKLGSADRSYFSAAFISDILYLQQPNLAMSWPWQEKTNFFHLFWQNNRENIRQLFRKRQRGAVREPMLRAIAGLIDQIYWCSGLPVSTSKPDSLLTKMTPIFCAPLNCEERVAYLLQCPDRYQAFIQLNELEEELNKKIMLALSKRV